MQVAALKQELEQLQGAELQARKLLQDQETRQQKCDQKHREAAAHLEDALQAAATRTSELGAQVDLAKRKVQHLEEQLGVAVAGRRELEAQLTRLCSAVRRAVCSPENRFSSNPAGSHRQRSPSPRRRHLQTKGMMKACTEGGNDLHILDLHYTRKRTRGAATHLFIMYMLA